MSDIEVDENNDSDVQNNSLDFKQFQKGNERNFSVQESGIQKEYQEDEDERDNEEDNYQENANYTEESDTEEGVIDLKKLKQQELLEQQQGSKKKEFLDNLQSGDSEVEDSEQQQVSEQQEVGLCQDESEQAQEDDEEVLNKGGEESGEEEGEQDELEDSDMVIRRLKRQNEEKQKQRQNKKQEWEKKQGEKLEKFQKQKEQQQLKEKELELKKKELEKKKIEAEVEENQKKEKQEKERNLLNKQQWAKNTFEVREIIKELRKEDSLFQEIEFRVFEINKKDLELNLANNYFVYRKQFCEAKFVREGSNLQEPSEVVSRRDKVFENSEFQGTYNQIFHFVSNGLILEISKVVNNFTQLALNGQKGFLNKIQNTLFSLDPEGKNLLMYATYYNYKNIVLYLLNMELDQFYSIPENNLNLFHYCAYYGRIQIAQILYHFERNSERQQLFYSIQNLLNKFSFKKTDFKAGKIQNESFLKKQHLDKQNQEILDKTPPEKSKFLGWSLFDELLQKFEKMICQQDKNGKNALHYGCLGRFQDSFKACRFLLEIDQEHEGFYEFCDLYEDIQNLDVFGVKEKQIPKTYLKAYLNLEQLIRKDDYNFIKDSFSKELQQIREKALNQKDLQGYTPLHIASFKENKEAVEYLIKRGAKTDVKEQKRGQVPIFYSQDKQVIEKITNLHKSCAEKNILEKEKEANQTVENFKILAEEKKLDFNQTRSIYLKTPLIEASENQNTPIIEYLLEQKSLDLNKVDLNGWTAIHHACKNGDLKTLKILVEQGCNVRTFSNTKMLPIHIAVINDQENVVQYLLELKIKKYTKIPKNEKNLINNISQTKKDKNQEQNKNKKILNFQEKEKNKTPQIQNSQNSIKMEKQKSQKTLKDNNNSQMENIQSDKNSIQQIKSQEILSFQNSPKNNQINNSKQNILIQEDQADENLKAVQKNPISKQNSQQIEIEKKIQISKQNSQQNELGQKSQISKQNSQLNEVEKKNLPQFKEELAFPVNEIYEKNRNLFLLAASHGSEKCLEILYFKDSDIFLQDEKGWNALHYAVAKGFQGIIKKLLFYDSEFNLYRNMKDNSGKQPRQLISNPSLLSEFNNIWLAIEDLNYDLVRQIVYKGQNVNAQTPKKKLTPLHLAIKKQHFLITKFLLENGALISLLAKVHLNLMPKNKRSIINEDVYTPLGYSAEILYFLNENDKKNSNILKQIENATKIYDLVETYL